MNREEGTHGLTCRSGLDLGNVNKCYCESKRWNGVGM